MLGKRNEKTLAIIKPDAVGKVGPILERISREGYYTTHCFRYDYILDIDIVSTVISCTVPWPYALLNPIPYLSPGAGDKFI